MWGFAAMAEGIMLQPCAPEAAARMRAAMRSSGCSIPVNAVVAEPLSHLARQTGGRRRIDLEGGNPHAALSADMDDSVIAMLEGEAFEIRGPLQQNAPPTVRADPFLRARLRTAAKNHLVCLSH